MKKNGSILTNFNDVGRLIKGRMQEALPLSYGQCEVLRFVSEQGSPTMRDIAAHFRVAAPSATSFINELVRHGHIKRVTDPRDRRIVCVALTKKGVAQLRTIEDRRAKVLENVLSSLSKRDREELNRILATIIITNA